MRIRIIVGQAENRRPRWKARKIKDKNIYIYEIYFSLEKVHEHLLIL